MKFIKWYSLFILFSLLLSAKANAQKQNLDKEISKVLSEHQVQGAAVALFKKDTVLWSGYFGKSNLAEDKPVTDKTLFGLGSISKTFLAVGAMIAQEKKQLNIYRPLKQMDLPLSFTNEFEVSNPIKIVHLLEHTSGFDEAHFDIFAKANSKTAFETIMVESRSALSTRWPPGNYYSYNTLNYIVSAGILEKQTKVPFQSFIKNQIFDPLKMNRATYFPTDISDLAEGYSGNNIEPFPDIPQWPGGSLSTNLDEMIRFTQLLLNSGTYQDLPIVSVKSIKAMETPESSLLAKQGVTFGYGKGLMQEFIGQHLFYGHNGSYGGFLSEFGYSRNADTGYVILLNNRNASAAIKEIKKLLLQPFNKEAVDAASQKINDESLRNSQLDIEGAYQPVTSNLEILYPFMRLADFQFIEKEKDKWTQKSILGDAQELVRIGEYIFKLEHEPMATTAFRVGEAETLWLGETSYRKISTTSALFQFYTAIICLLAFIFSFFSISYSIIRRLILKREISRLQYLTFFSTLSLILMAVAVVTLYNPMRLYSFGALLFYISGWSFLILSFCTPFYLIKYLFNKKRTQKWLTIQIGICTTTCIIISSYLFYWEIIGLKLWNY